MGEKTCYQHSNNIPVTEIHTFFCPSDSICNLEDQKFAWITANKQNLGIEEKTPDNSQLYKKFTDKECELMEFMNQDLKNGRDCMDTRECEKGLCNTTIGICVGEEEGESCTSHDQCHLGLGCITHFEWPYYKRCQPLRKDGESCQIDADCELDYMCWYETETDASAESKKCVKMYSLPLFSEFGYKKQSL